MIIQRVESGTYRLSADVQGQCQEDVSPEVIASLRGSVVDSDWITEETPVTFQIAMVGRDGIVVGSDRLGRYFPPTGPSPIVQAISQRSSLPQSILHPKYFTIDNESLVCFAAGGATAISLAQQISATCDPALCGGGESAWERSVHNIMASKPPLPNTSQYPDEILIVRKDVFSAFWLVLVRPLLLLRSSSRWSASTCAPGQIPLRSSYRDICGPKIGPYPILSRWRFLLYPTQPKKSHHLWVHRST
jgi:hypothetical protein